MRLVAASLTLVGFRLFRMHTAYMSTGQAAFSTLHQQEQL